MDDSPTQDPTVSWETVFRGLQAFASDEANHDQVAGLVAQLLYPFTRPPLFRKYFRFWEKHGFHLTPVHFYQPLPDTRLLSPKLWEKPSDLAGIDMNETEQLRLLCHVFGQFQDEYACIPQSPTGLPHEFYFDNGRFGGTDALVLYCMVRAFQPRLIIEIGSGFSSLISAKAALKNKETQLTCIEPYPDEFLKAGLPGLSELVPKKVEELDLSYFSRLGANDILFIDSSHVVKIGGDVNYLFLEITPRLKPGVLVHVDDIFLPNQHRRDWVLEEFRFWSEQYLLQAFLMFNSAWEVLFSNSYMAHKYRDIMREVFPNSPWWGGGSFWMRRREV